MGIAVEINFTPQISATVIADASWCPYTKAGGWACWISSSHFKVQKTGLFHKLASTPTEAEKWAALNGLWFAHEAGARNILIQTDCLHVVNLINNKGLEDLDKFFGATIYAKHVKGHTHRPEPRFWVNRWCDEQAKIEMRKQRGRINTSGKRA